MGINRVRSVLFFLIIWRLCSVFIVQTFHVPDEYWQSLEVAHKLTFGYGYLTWEWTTKIRSYIYPFLISILYHILRFLHIDHAILLINLPRIFQALLSAYADYRFYIWTKSKWCLFAISINWYWYYCATRSLINSFETSLTIIALSIFPWRDRENSYSFLWIISFLFTIRPTSAIIWLPLCFYHICTRSKDLLHLIKNYLLIGATCLSISTIIDSLCYGTFVITPWEFFKINVLNNISESYGVENPFWYFLSGLPVILGIEYFTFMRSILRIFYWRQFHRETILLITIFWTIFVFSCLGHKEFRFILPLLPIIIYINNSFYGTKRISELRRKLFVFLFILSNLIPGLYFSLIHQRGSLNTLEFIRNDLSNEKDSILFLTPCHATPLYSHLHKNVSVRFLKCEPNLENKIGYIEEAQQFFASPQFWINENYEKIDQKFLPDYIVVYDNFEKSINFFLTKYKEIYKSFDSHFPQPKYGNYLVVYKKNHPG